jgi:hypothetical protein
MSLCEALHGRRPWPELELHGPAMRNSPERGKRGKEEGERERGGQLGGVAWGGGGLKEGGRRAAMEGRSHRAAPLFSQLAVCELCTGEKAGRRKEKGEENEKEGKEKEKNMENFPNLKFSQK